MYTPLAQKRVRMPNSSKSKKRGGQNGRPFSFIELRDASVRYMDGLDRMMVRFSGMYSVSELMQRGITDNEKKQCKTSTRKFRPL